MAYFKVNEPNKAPKWIKSIDRANGTLEFSDTKEGCFQQDSGFFANSELDYLKFHFTEAYPEIKYLEVDSTYDESMWDTVEGDAIGENDHPVMNPQPVAVEQINALENDNPW